MVWRRILAGTAAAGVLLGVLGGGYWLGNQSAATVEGLLQRCSLDGIGYEAALCYDTGASPHGDGVRAGIYTRVDSGTLAEYGWEKWSPEAEELLAFFSEEQRQLFPTDRGGCLFLYQNRSTGSRDPAEEPRKNFTLVLWSPEEERLWCFVFDS